MNTNDVAPLRVGVIGAGAGRFHLAAYQKIAGVHIAALADVNTTRAEPIAAEFHVPRVYADYREMFAREHLDAVSLAVPNDWHAPIAKDALAAGLHVLCEKPLANTLEAAEDLARAVRASDRVFAMNFNYRLRGDSATAKKFLDEGHAGKIYYARAGWMRASGIPGWGGWFTQKEQSGGGPLIDLGVHILDLTLYLLNYPRVLSVSATTHAVFGPRGMGAFGGGRFEPGPGGFSVEDLAVALMRLEGDVTLVLETSWATYSHFEDDYYVHLLGADAGIEINVHNYATKDTLRFYTDVAGTRTEVKPRLPETLGIPESLREFVEAIREKRAPRATIEHGLTVQRVIDAVYRSARAEREIRLD
jgi:predicted dehydrogenase